MRVSAIGRLPGAEYGFGPAPLDSSVCGPAEEGTTPRTPATEGRSSQEDWNPVTRCCDADGVSACFLATSRWNGFLCFADRMNRVLINFAHPARRRSKMNAALRAAVESLDGVTLNDLYAQYPDFLIDVRREQELCETHEVIIFQHPFYWYSTPSIVKEWMDLVLRHGWAYGSSATALRGKTFLQAITAGGDDETYREGGYNRFTIAQLTSPFQATANLCGMDWLPPFAVLGIHRGLSPEAMRGHAEAYKRCVLGLRDGRLDLEKARTERYLNSSGNALIEEAN